MLFVGRRQGGHQSYYCEARVTASELKKKIEDALVRNAEIDASKITVEVQGSKAILKGSVRAGAEREEAERGLVCARDYIRGKSNHAGGLEKA